MKNNVGDGSASSEIAGVGTSATTGPGSAVTVRAESSDVIWDGDGRLTAAAASALGSPLAQADPEAIRSHDRPASRRLMLLRRGRSVLVVGAVVACVVLLGRLLQHGALRASDRAAQSTSTSAPSALASATISAAAVAPPTASIGAVTTSPVTTSTGTASPGTVAVAPTNRTLPSPSVGPANPPLARYLLPTSWALAANGKLYLRGRVPDKATVDKLATRAATVATDGDVVVDLTIDPSVSANGSMPLLFEDAVHFADGSDVVRVEEQFLPEFARFLLERNATATVRLFANADTSTDADLMVRRSTACSDFIRRFGLDVRRISITTRGDAGVGASAARPGPSVELAVEGLFGG